jgi:hypothetical protein
MRKLIAICLFFASCIEPYDFRQDDSSRIIVVEGYVSDNPGDSEIKLSWSGVFQRNDFDFISDAEVMVVENEAVEHNFSYQEDGLYKPVQEDFMAKTESSYRLKIVLEEQVYESDQVSLVSSLDVDNISFMPAADLNENPSLEFFLTSSIDENASKFYIYSFEETWEAVAMHSINKVIKPIFIFDEDRNPINIDFETTYEGNTTHCWPYKKSEGLRIITTEGLTSNQLVNFPVFGVSLESPKLLFKYSVLVNQYAISKEVHHFFNMLGDFSENSGFLYDIQPGYIEGNIYNKSAPKDKVIGIFYAATHNSFRHFISFNELPHNVRSIVTQNHPSCDYQSFPEFGGFPISNIPNDTLTEALQVLKDSLLSKEGLYILDYDKFDEDGESYISMQLINLVCADCRVSGSNIKPAWWD